MFAFQIAAQRVLSCESIAPQAVQILSISAQMSDGSAGVESMRAVQHGTNLNGLPTDSSSAPFAPNNQSGVEFDVLQTCKSSWKPGSYKVTLNCSFEARAVPSLTSKTGMRRVCLYQGTNFALHAGDTWEKCVGKEKTACILYDSGRSSTKQSRYPTFSYKIARNAVCFRALCELLASLSSIPKKSMWYPKRVLSSKSACQCRAWNTCLIQAWCKWKCWKGTIRLHLDALYCSHAIADAQKVQKPD